MPTRAPGGTLDLKAWSLRLLIFALVLVCYWPALHGGILWDDPAHLTKPELRSWDGLVRIWTDLRATQQYYPVLFSAFWLEHRLWGDSTFGYHLLNVCLHATSCCLLAALLRRLWSMPQKTSVPAGTEWFAAALFAVHPVCVESVAWISEQKNTLSLVFYLSSALVYLRFRETKREPANSRAPTGHSPSHALRWYALASVLFLFAIGSKTVTVTLPAALLVVRWWKQGKLSWRRDVVPLIPWFVLAGAMGLFTSWFERTWIGASGAEFQLTFWQRLLLAGRVLWFYFGKVIWPGDLMFFYPRWEVATQATQWIGYVVAAILVTVVLWSLRKRARGPLASWLLYAGSLFPALGFFNVYPFLFSYVADHFQYLASVCLIAAIASGGGVMAGAALHRDAKTPNSNRGVKPLLPAAAAILGGAVVVGLAVVSHFQSALYQSNETLFRANVARNPSAWLAHHNLALALARAPDRHDEAMQEFREVIRLKPDFPDSHYGLGMELARIPGRKAEAMAEYEKAIELRPIYAEAHYGLGLELARLPGREADAIAHFEAALRVKPQLAEVHAHLADALVKFPERLPEAMAHYAEALHLNPNLAWVHCHLAFQLAHLPGRQEEALAHYEQALRIQPDSIDAHNGLAIAYIMMNRPADARREWETVLRIDPTQDSARRNLRRLDEMEGR